MTLKKGEILHFRYKKNYFWFIFVEAHDFLQYKKF